ncbi:myb-like protein X [Hyperolius riggenbachi]|uniref:myb-like protein X n=1 Tax=Hyperolius riggenbachi TaxID=752182 RepID=UPI0035A3B774
MTQPSKPETPENAVSEGQEKPLGISAESPKASQPTCLRGGFTRLFLKRTEQNNTPEDSSINNQNTEEMHGIRGKKRRVLGGNMFRIPCFRSAERTDTGEHNKGQLDSTEQQCHQTAPEEDLKPYSKASFLKKIRGYRLMREREATEKLKVIEVDQRNEGSAIGEHSKKHLELGRKVAEHESHENILARKGKAVQKQSLESRRTRSNDQNQGSISELKKDEGNTIQQQECQDKNIRDLVETVYEKKSCGEREDGKRQDLAEPTSQGDKVEKLEHDLQEQGNKADREKKKGNMIEHENLIARPEGQCHKTTKQPTGRELGPTNNLETQQVKAEMVQETENTLLQHSKDMQTKKMEAVANDLTEQGLGDTMEKPSNVLPEDGSPKTKVTELEKGLPEQKSNINNEEKLEAELKQKNKYAKSEMENTLLGQVCHAEVPVDLGYSGCAEDSRKNEDKLKGSAGNVAEHKSHPEKLGESEHSSVEKDINEKQAKDHFLKESNSPENIGQPENCCLEHNNHIHIVVETDGLVQKETKPRDHLQEQENVNGIRDCLVGQESQTKKRGESEGQIRCSENVEATVPPHDGYENTEGKTKVQLLEKCTDYEGGSCDHLLKQETKKMLEENNCVEDLRKLEKVLSSKGKDSSDKDEILITHIICTATPEESCAELPTFKANKAAKPVNVHFYKQETNQDDIQDGDNGMMECENTDWASLQVEVKDMVQWLVDEASDRLTDLATDYTQDPPGTE